MNSKEYNARSGDKFIVPIVTSTNNIFVLHYYNQNNLNNLRKNLYFTRCEYNIMFSKF